MCVPPGKRSRTRRDSRAQWRRRRLGDFSDVTGLCGLHWNNTWERRGGEGGEQTINHHQPPPPCSSSSEKKDPLLQLMPCSRAFSVEKPGLARFPLFSLLFLLLSRGFSSLTGVELSSDFVEESLQVAQLVHGALHIMHPPPEESLRRRRRKEQHHRVLLPLSLSGCWHRPAVDFSRLARAPAESGVLASDAPRLKAGELPLEEELD
ncbi:unnamed protein product [Pleuronectes platessa]|uniref:Uncharacterized protein n=1 Tax=Pleuronectes platessa TaxID=8262 RepID=A0A9N7Z590_PLEPL|nr:unnamed protein product [Pleuronectes platessa]